MNFLEALAEGKGIEKIMEYKAFDFPRLEWEGELAFFLDFPSWRYCYFDVVAPMELQGEKFRLIAKKEKQYRPSPESFNMSHAEPGQVFKLTTEPDPDSLGKWTKAEKVD